MASLFFVTLKIAIFKFVIFTFLLMLKYLNIFKNWSWSQTFLILSVIFGFTWFVLVPAMQVPDELAHYFKVIESADFKNPIILKDNTLGANLPKSVVVFASEMTFVNGKSLPFDPSVKFEFLKYNQFLDQSLDYSDTLYTPFTNTATKLLPVYLPALLGAFVAIQLSLSPIYIYFLAKFFSLLFYVLAGFYLIRKSNTAYQPILFVCLLLPMSLFLATGITADTVSILVAIAFTTMVFSLRQTSQKLTKLNCLNVILLTIFLALIKSTYAPLALLIFLLPPFFEQKPKDFILKSILTLVPILAVGYTMVFMDKVSVPLRLDITINPSEQLTFILTNPIEFILIFFNTLKLYYLEWLKGVIGVLGWLDTPLPIWSYFLGYGLLFLCIQNPDGKLKLKIWELILILIIFIGSFLGVLFFLYLLWNSPQSPTIEGFQGRYLLPFVPMILILLKETPLSRFKINKSLIIWGTILLLYQTTYSLFARYYL
jgi:uncharacterized membrane protein